MIEKLIGLAAAVAAVLLGVSPAAATDVAGWYLGIYAGASHANDMDVRSDNYLVQLFGPGTVQTPSSYINDGGVDPDFFSFLNLGPQHYPFADFGYGTALLTTGTVGLGNSATLGGVAGFAFGNGLRIEGDVSASQFSAGTFTSISDMFQDADGDVDPSGVWTWTFSGNTPTPSDPPAPFDDFGFSYRTNVEFLLVNAFYDIDTGTIVTPYLGAGVGAALITNSCGCAAPAQTQLAPAAQLGAGIRVALGGPATLDLGYRYKAAAGSSYHVVLPTFDGFGEYEGIAYRASGMIGVHTFQAGVTFALP